MNQYWFSLYIEILFLYINMYNLYIFFKKIIQFAYLLIEPFTVPHFFAKSFTLIQSKLNKSPASFAQLKIEAYNNYCYKGERYWAVTRNHLVFQWFSRKIIFISSNLKLVSNIGHKGRCARIKKNNWHPLNNKNKVELTPQFVANILSSTAHLSGLFMEF